MLGNWHSFCHLLIFFQNMIWNMIRVSNSLDPDQAEEFGGTIRVQTVYKGYQLTKRYFVCPEASSTMPTVVGTLVPIFIHNV